MYCTNEPPLPPFRIYAKGMHHYNEYTPIMHKKSIFLVKIFILWVDKRIFMQYITRIPNDFKFLGGYIL